MEKEAERHESFIQYDGLIFLVMVLHKIGSHSMLQNNLLFFCCGQTCWSKCLIVEL